MSLPSWTYVSGPLRWARLSGAITKYLSASALICLCITSRQPGPPPCRREPVPIAEYFKYICTPSDVTY